MLLGTILVRSRMPCRTAVCAVNGALDPEMQKFRAVWYHDHVLFDFFVTGTAHGIRNRWFFIAYRVAATCRRHQMFGAASRWETTLCFLTLAADHASKSSTLWEDINDKAQKQAGIALPVDWERVTAGRFQAEENGSGS